MKTQIKKTITVFASFSIMTLFFSCTKTDTSTGTTSSISIVSSMPTAGATVTNETNIIVQVKYATDATAKTTTGFVISAAFENATGNLYGTTNLSAITKTTIEKSGNLTFTIPISSISNGANAVAFPVKLYFNLGNAETTTTTNFLLLATSDKIQFVK